MIEERNTKNYEIVGKPKTCCEAFFGCCDRGGCCRQIPSKIICDQENRVIRINLMFYPTRVFTQSEGIVDIFPQELIDGGISQDLIDEWFVHRLGKVNQFRNSCMFDAAAWISALGLCVIIPYMCSRQKIYLERWSSELLNWQNEFNQTVLEKKGLFVKTQSNCHVSYDKNGKHRHIERWVSIALTPEEVQKLQNEPHLFGDIETGCCGGPDESKLCMHP